MTQTELIKDYLQRGNTITPFEALQKFGCFRLGARIYDLKKDGLEIKTTIIESGGKHFAQYKIGSVI
jgi:hypothetical protein